MTTREIGLLDTMFITSYNCKGLNVANILNVGAMHFIYQINRLTTTKVDSTYIDKLLLECDISLIHEHWLLNNR